MWKSTKSHILLDSYAFNSNWTHFIRCFRLWYFGIITRGALRDLRYFFSTNNLRIVKSFLEVANESLIGKMWKFQNQVISFYLYGIYLNYVCIMAIFRLFMFNQNVEIMKSHIFRWIITFLPQLCVYNGHFWLCSG